MSFDDPMAGLRQAYADTFGELRSQERCFHYLMPHWVGEKHARRATLLIGNYGAFDTDVVLDKIETITGADPTAQFAFGREMSPVLYVETEYPEPVYQILEHGSHATELYEIANGEPIGNVRTFDNPHDHCRHRKPPIPDGAWAARRGNERTYIRAWWDD